jgi:hypothetical protein
MTKRKPFVNKVYRKWEAGKQKMGIREAVEMGSSHDQALQWRLRQLYGVR